MRKFSGGADSHAAALHYDRQGQNVILSLHAASTATLQIADNVYGKGSLAALEMVAGKNTTFKHSTAEHGNWWQKPLHAL